MNKQGPIRSEYPAENPPAKTKMRESVWLKKGPIKPGKWFYGLVRWEDGTIRVAEVMEAGFSEVGTRLSPQPWGKRDETVPARLFPGERRLIVQDLYLACCKELGKKPDVEGFKR